MSRQRFIGGRALALALLLIAISGTAAAASPRLFTAASAEQAFNRNGFSTKVDLSTPLGSCARSGYRRPSCQVLKIQAGEHVSALLSDKRFVKSGNSYNSVVMLYVLDSTKAANAYGSYIDAKCIYLSGKPCESTYVRLQAQNVVVAVLRKGVYAAQARAALATLTATSR